MEPAIISRDQHNISRKNISPNALKVLYRLHDAGYSAYLVGGSVRDLLLGRSPKDFDVATNARPEQVKKIFRNSLLIGRRFRLVHVRFGHEIIEVATFRAGDKKSHKQRQMADTGMLLRDNVYGTLEEDAERRDFTINALYYNIADFSIVDYCGGVEDLRNKNLRIIGEPRQRYHEDPVRLLRAIRFAGKLELQLDPATSAPISELAPLLQHVPAARLFDEVLKLFHSGHSAQILPLLREYHLFEQLFPQIASCLNSEYKMLAEIHLKLICQNTDARIANDKTVSAGFLFASLLWLPYQKAIDHHRSQEKPITVARNLACHEVIAKQIEQITIPKRFSIMIREIWDLQYRFKKTAPKQIKKMLSHPRFRAAYDFLLLRAEADTSLQGLAKFWQQIYESHSADKPIISDNYNSQPTRHRKHKKSL